MKITFELNDNGDVVITIPNQKQTVAEAQPRVQVTKVTARKAKEDKPEEKQTKKAFPTKKRYDVIKGGNITLVEGLQAAADMVGCHITSISKPLSKGQEQVEIKGFIVRKHSDEELEKTLKEIEENRRKPYKINPKI